MRQVFLTIAFAVIVGFNGFVLAEEKEVAAPAEDAPLMRDFPELAAGAGKNSEDAAPAAALAPATKRETIWLEDDLPANAQAQGNWLWDTASPASGAKAHGHLPAKGLQSHGFTADPVTIPTGSMIAQQVWLDPADPPKGIMLKFKLANGEEVGVYWEGEEEVFNPGEEEEVWYYGLLPELGKWTTLEILAEDLGIEEEQVIGISFVTFDGRVLWDKTVLTQAPAVEEVESFPQLPPAPPKPPKQS